MNRYFRAKIIENRPLNNFHNLLTLSQPGISSDVVPGQFCMIETAGSYDPLLKRPFSIARKTHEGFGFLYRIRGKGTENMRQLTEGMTVNVLGPLGNGYPPVSKNTTPLLVAGGIGIASLFTLAERLGKQAYLFYGGRNKDELLMFDELRGMVKELVISTDDGSIGEKGTVVDALNEFLASEPSATGDKLIYACGPAPMLKAVSKIAIGKGIRGYISMEENMACGLGACLGCAVRTKNGYKRVCKEGPVFPIEEVVW